MYGYRIDGPQDWHQGHRFDNSVALIDPYAKLIEGRRVFGDSTERFSKLYGTYDFSSLPFDWGDNYAQPNIPEVKTVTYEWNQSVLNMNYFTHIQSFYQPIFDS